MKHQHKDGHRVDKKHEAMHRAEVTRHAQAQPPEPQTDQQDIISFKPGGEDDRTVRDERAL